MTWQAAPPPLPQPEAPKPDERTYRVVGSLPVAGRKTGETVVLSHLNPEALESLVATGHVVLVRSESESDSTTEEEAQP